MSFAWLAWSNPVAVWWSFLVLVSLGNITLWLVLYRRFRGWRTGRGNFGLEPMLLLGRTSLFVYWVHVEIAYGVVSYPLHYALPLAWSAAGFVVVLLVMYRAAGWWARRPQTVWIPQRLRTSN